MGQLLHTQASLAGIALGLGIPFELGEIIVGGFFGGALPAVHLRFFQQCNQLGGKRGDLVRLDLVQVQAECLDCDLRLQDQRFNGGDVVHLPGAGFEYVEGIKRCRCYG
ncbi:hypothetical protein D3C86_1713780 [compost metagenome]